MGQSLELELRLRVAAVEAGTAERARNLGAKPGWKCAQHGCRSHEKGL